MKLVTYTEGPWEMSAFPDDGTYEISSSKAPVRNLGGDRKRHVILNYCQNRNDAFLILAAPDLYEALTAILAEMDRGVSTSAARKKAAAAVNRARGK